MAGLIFKNITRPLDGKNGFREFNLEIDDGEFVSLVGPEGCGNIELIRMAEGYGGSYEGDIYINDRRVTRFTRNLLGVSLVNDIPFMGTPRKEISARLKARRIDGARIKEIIDLAAHDTGATEYMDTSWSKLDAPARLLAGLARAQALGARVVLLIDPFNDMDLRTAARMRLAVMDFHTRTGVAFAMATSCARNAMLLSTRIVMLSDGKIRQSDPPQIIYDYPSDRFIAEYFGNDLINIIPAQLQCEGAEVYAVFGQNRILVPQGKLCKFIDEKYVGGRVLLGIRPENIRYEQAFLSIAPESAVISKIRHVELAGSETYLHMNLEGISGDIVARVDPRCIANPGDQMTLAIDSNRMHFFDIDTGKSIMSRL